MKKAATFLRYHALRISTRAGSGHPTSSLSAADLMAGLFEGVFRFDFEHPDNPGNDRLIFSKGHASPLYYSLFALAGAIPVEELDTYRQFTSRLEGHPTPRFPFTEAATGSLGQGLSVGVGIALAMRQENSELRMQNAELPKVYVLLGDGEMAEGSVWEACEIASHYKLDNLVAIVDVNRLGQSGETMLGWDTDTYRNRLIAFGWETTVIDGHDTEQIANAYKEASLQAGRAKPFAIIAKTKKGCGISFLEDKENWHGKPIAKEDLEKATEELQQQGLDLSYRVVVRKPEGNGNPSARSARSGQVGKTPEMKYVLGEQVATRKAYGTAISRIGEINPKIVVLDAEVKNSTYAELFKDKFPDRFYEMYIAEQNMVGVAAGFARRGFIPFVSTFAAFFTRAFDQIRMAALGQAGIKFVGSHAGISIGEDGPSQMGLEDLSMFRSVHDCAVLYPSDAVSAERLVEGMVHHKGMVYMRTSRPATPVIYPSGEKFPIGGCKVHKKQITNNKEQKVEGPILIVAAGVTLHEALKAQEELGQQGIQVIVMDCYSIKPIDTDTLKRIVQEEKIPRVITVEDHWFDGGLGDAVLNVFSTNPRVSVEKLAVKEMPRSGKPGELLSWAGIDAEGIVRNVLRNALPSI